MKISKQRLLWFREQMAELIQLHGMAGKPKLQLLTGVINCFNHAHAHLPDDDFGNKYSITQLQERVYEYARSQGYDFPRGFPRPTTDDPVQMSEIVRGQLCAAGLCLLEGVAHDDSQTYLKLVADTIELFPTAGVSNDAKAVSPFEEEA